MAVRKIGQQTFEGGIGLIHRIDVHGSAGESQEHLVQPVALWILSQQVIESLKKVLEPKPAAADDSAEEEEDEK